MMASLRGDCTEDEQRSLEKHLSECDACRQEMESFRAVYELTECDEQLDASVSDRLFARTIKGMGAADTPSYGKGSHDSGTHFIEPHDIRSGASRKDRFFRYFYAASAAALVIACTLLVGLHLKDRDAALRQVNQDPQLHAAMAPKLVPIPGGTFRMGDIFGEGARNERPVHTVQVQGYHLSPHEVTVAEYERFVEATQYVSSSEVEIRREHQLSIIAQIENEMKQPSGADIYGLLDELTEAGGCFAWNHRINNFEFMLDCNWKKPYFEQSRNDPVVCMSWLDALHYCNWLSRLENLPEAYDVKTGELLDENGKPTRDIAKVKGYRLPTEAEWEYAAREGGREVRFGNGKDVAHADEINFDAKHAVLEYAKPGSFRNRTTPVGSFKPNRLGLYDMSGNAWEWCHDALIPYTDAGPKETQVTLSEMRVVRGGRWGGSAHEARVFHRAGFHPNNRCNNSGFRLARSL